MMKGWLTSQPFFCNKQARFSNKRVLARRNFVYYYQCRLYVLPVDLYVHLFPRENNNRRIYKNLIEYFAKNLENLIIRPKNNQSSYRSEHI